MLVISGTCVMRRPGGYRLPHDGGARSADDVEATIDINRLPRDEACPITGEGCRRDADVVDGHELTGWRLRSGLLEQLVEVVDPRSRARLQRTRRNDMHSDTFEPQLKSEIAARRFERRLNRTHKIVVFDDFVSAVIAH